MPAPMKILFVNQYYWPDAAATAQQLSDLAEHLASRGHDVTVVCSRGQYAEGSNQRVPKTETRAGVKIRRLSAPGFGKTSTFGRVLDYAGFHLLCGLWMLACGWRYRVIVTLTTPPLIGLYATFVRLLTFGRTKHVCWAMDLHPDCEFQLGLWKRSNPVFRLLEILNDFHFRKANASVALGEHMRQRLAAKGVRPDRLHVISVWNRADEIAPVPQGESPLAQKLGLADRFVVMYSGNAGVLHSFDAVFHAMLALRDDARVKFVFVGGGKRLREIEAFIHEHHLENFIKLPYFPREELSASLALGDAHLVTLRDGMTGVALPCKTYGILAAARPVLFVGPHESDTADHIRAADAGFVVPTDDTSQLAAVIQRLVDDPAQAQRLGENGRAWFEKHTERNVCCEQWRELLEHVGGR